MSLSRPAGFLLVILLVAIHAMPVEAAAELSRAVPSPGTEIDEAPESIELFFTQDVEQAEVSLDGDELETELDGERVAAAVETLADGEYVVEWIVTSEVDGRETSGRFQFEVRSEEVGEPPAEVDPETRAERVESVGNDNRTEVLLWTALGIAAAAVLALVFFYFRTSIPTFGTTRIEGGLPPPGQSPPEHEDGDHD